MRAPATTPAPTFEQVQADVRRRGPLTQAYGEVQARKLGLRRPAGEQLPYSVRRSRGTDFIASSVASGRITEDDLVQAVMQFAQDRAQTASMADITPFYGYKK